MGILEALGDSLNATQIDKRDDVVIALAGKLAQEIDAASEPRVIGDLSSRLLAVLSALLLTPLSRNGQKGTVVNDNVPGNVLDELRARRARTDGTSHLYPPT